MKRNMIYMVGALLSSAILTFGCSEDDIPSYSKITVDKNDLFIKIEKPTDEVNITEGNGNYKITVADENIATAKVEGSRIVFTALKNGRTTATVTDWAKHSTVINVRVKEDFDLALDKQELTLIKDVNPTGLVYISSGNGEYQIKSSNEEIATATLTEDGKVAVAFVSGGFADITITDADSKSAVVKVAACEYELILDAIPVAWKVATDNAIKIKSGNGEYQIASDNESIATAELVTNEENAGEYAVKITGVAKGETNVTLTDKMGLSQNIAIKVRNGFNIETTSIDNLEIGIPQTIAITGGSEDYSWSASNQSMTCSISEDKTQLIVNGTTSSLNQTLTFTDKTFGESKTINVRFIDYPFLEYHPRWYVKGAFNPSIAYSFIETQSDGKEHIKVGTAKSSSNNNALNGYHISFNDGRGEGKKSNPIIFTTKGAGILGIGGGGDDKSFTITDLEIIKREYTKPEDEKDGKGKFWIRFKEVGKEEYSYIITWF